MKPLHDTDPLGEAPLLRTIPKEDPLRAPEGFFEAFPHRVQAAAMQRRSPWRGAWMRFGALRAGPRPAWAAALALAVLAGGYLLMRPGPVPAILAEAAPAPIAAEALGELGLADEDLIASLPDARMPLPGAGFTLDELESYLLIAGIPEDLIAEQP